MSKDERLTYEAPRAMRLGDARAGQGVCGAPGSGDVQACYGPGNTANLECNEPGASATGYCSYSGNSADPTCLEPGSGVVD